MLKSFILAGAALAATPALAQTAPSQPGTAPTGQTTTTTPTTTAPAQGGTTTAPAHGGAATTQGGTTTQAAPSGSTGGQTASNDQIAQLVDQDFAKYDQANTGALNQAQFGEWMVALRSASEPSFKAGTPEATSWTAQAFTTADADKSQSVSKAELKSFLTGGA